MAKYVDTPMGKFEMPSWAAERLDKMTDIELLEEYVEKCRDFIDPFLFQEMADRNLIHRGDYYADIVKRLEQRKYDNILDQVAADELGVDDELEP